MTTFPSFRAYSVWVREKEQRRLCLNDHKALPVRRLFEPQWEYRLPRGTSRIERLSALATEANVCLILPNDFLFKVDTASMKESLEVRVPMLDEDLVAFGLSLPHHLKVQGRTCKRVLRAVAQRVLPPTVAEKPKRGFAVPLERWIDTGFNERLRELLLGPSSQLSAFFRPEAYTKIIRALCETHIAMGKPQQPLYGRAIMLLADK